MHEVVGREGSARLDAASRLRRYEEAFAELDAPFAFVDLDAMWTNAEQLLSRAGDKPIRVASKSVRCRPLQREILDSNDRFDGLMTFTLAETLWLAGHGFENLLLAYPSTDRAALRELGELTAERPDTAPIVMVDSVEHLDLIESVTANPVRLCIDLDAGYWPAGGRVKIGPRRSPLHTPEQARALAEDIARRPNLKLVALMSYEGHIAGFGDRVAGKHVQNAIVGWMQRRSIAELRERRARAVQLVREVADLKIVNAGGTGDLQLVAQEPAMTEATAGSGFYAPTLFDTYSSFTLQPAAMFALPICRRPDEKTVTALGGGYLASGVGAKDRMPSPYLPIGLNLNPIEGTGEVQTPLTGAAATRLKIGDKVYFRHTKSGELCERFDRLYLVRGAEIVATVPTYRGEGRTFL
ncbi:alanine racemase [Mycobacterium intermedium]|uniref:Alanine racemase n=1 Tax=Mycobacterium intermedium TaxID=28445 RepID=A0A1E3SIH6_MYCIE|nr:amino acid deaminase/aldolase [Mycobacterium intermedium]MCV6964436.1 amino acid deaminase/aldolase [Mycobacterium intermedium]ODR01915.1 alanine racemase [Mycobacterium intermedium]OPE49444.1 alanine racemase [Mycobacterium intermedium]ORB08645.1 alanine racemase [Mycobacterium intermedium]